MRKSRHWLYAAVLLTAAFFSLLLLASALWIPAKAELAQWLIERSWQDTLSGNPDARPWPWADTRPAAELFVPRLSVRQFVLEGNSGRNLAFGPVMLDGTLDGRDRVISGHRDTHFRFLERLRPGDRIRLKTLDSSRWFEVRYAEIIDSSRRKLVIDPGIERISLVTCYPFASLEAGGPLRYVVTALPAKSSLSPRPPSSG
ncbi:MAG: class GN sortase [Xanthomonadales bacterium]|nr:class GN sortase [Gammaproteobacteria bacterium]MBT8054088.1 class GN sortase [Gammaproteobacteria bacterium]NNK51411.1 class GN sortase [Xanthomonadales bacterium]